MANVSLPQSLEDFAELFEKRFPSHDFRWKQYPNRWMALCPFHEEKNPSFNIFVAPDGTLSFKCFACGKGGTVYTLLRHFGIKEYEGEREDWVKRRLIEEFVESAREHLLDCLKSDQGESLRVKMHFFKTKILPKYTTSSLEEAVRFYNVGIVSESLLSEWEKKGGEYKEVLQKLEEKVKIYSKIGNVIFPYYSLSGVLTSFKLRDIASSSRTSRVFKLFEKKVSSYFGGLGFLNNWLKDKDGWIYPVIITEGETDALSSFINSSIPTLAVGSASNYVSLLDDKFSEFGFFPLIFPDFDPYSLISMGAGREAIVHLHKERKRRKEKEAIYVLVDEDAYAGAKDINEALTSKGVRIEDIFKRKNSILRINEAVSTFYDSWQEWKLLKYEERLKKMEARGVEGIWEVYSDFLSLRKKQEEKILSVDELEGLQEGVSVALGRFPAGEVSFIASFGGVGKTTYAIILAFMLGAKENRKALFWTTEHSPKSLRDRLLRVKETPELQEIYEKGKDNVFFKTDLPEPFINSNKELNKKAFRTLKKLLDKYDVVILDPYLTFVEGEENDNVVARKVIKEIRSLLSEYDTPKFLIFLHHFGKIALNEALLEEKDILSRDGNIISIKREKVEGLLRSIRGASAIVDTSRYVEAIVLTSADRERFILTIKTNENTRREGIGEKIPELSSFRSKIEKLAERVRELVMERKIFANDEVFRLLEDYGITNLSDFEEKYQELPLQVLEDFVSRVEDVDDDFKGLKF